MQKEAYYKAEDVLNLFISDDFYQYNLPENYGFQVDLIDNDIDATLVDIDDLTVIKCFPKFFDFEDKFDDDAYSIVCEQCYDALLSINPRLETWEKSGIYYDTKLSTTDVANLIAELLCMPTIGEIQATSILCYALDNGFADLLPTDNSAESVLKLEHLYWLWFAANNFKLFGQKVA